MDIVRDRMRARSNQRHLAAEYVQELGQLVYAGSSEHLANASNSGVVRTALNDNRPILQNCHGAKLVDFEFGAIEASSPLTKNHGAGGIDDNSDARENENGQQRAQECTAKNEVEGSFYHGIGIGERRS